MPALVVPASPPVLAVNAAPLPHPAPACSKVRSRANSGDTQLSQGSIEENAGDSTNIGGPAVQR